MQPEPMLNIAHLARELQQPSAVRTLVIEGAPAVRSKLVTTLAAQLKYRLVHPDDAPIDSHTQQAALLFFDEADSLFDKRSSVHDSHDRYANLVDSFSGLIVYGVIRAGSLPPGILKNARIISTPPH